MRKPDFHARKGISRAAVVDRDRYVFHESVVHHHEIIRSVDLDRRDIEYQRVRIRVKERRVDRIGKIDAAIIAGVPYAPSPIIRPKLTPSIALRFASSLART